MWQKIGQSIRFYADNDNRDVSARQVLLIFDPMVDSKENIELHLLRSIEEFAIFQSGETGIAHRLAIVPA